MSGAGKQALGRNAQGSAPVDIHSLREMDADDYNSGYGRSTLHLPPPRSLTGTILMLGAVAVFLWLALATAALSLLNFDRPASRLDLVEWADVLAAVSRPLALNGVVVMVGLRLYDALGRERVGSGHMRR